MSDWKRGYYVGMLIGGACVALGVFLGRVLW